MSNQIGLSVGPWLFWSQIGMPFNRVEFMIFG